MTILTKRSIRLKEFVPYSEKIHIPSKQYLMRASQINPNQAFFQRADKYGLMQNHLHMTSDKKVVILGDSFIENIFVDESKRITARMEEYFLFSNMKVQVLNAGLSGATGLGLLNNLLNKIICIKPDIIIFSQPSIDFTALLYEKGYYNDSTLYGNIQPFNNTDSTIFETIQDNINQLSMIVSMVANLCHTQKIKLFFSTCCSNSSKRQLKMMNDVIRNNQHLGYDVIDLDNIITKGELYFYDKQHLNEKGSDYVAKVYFDNIYKEIFIDKKFILRKHSVTFNTVSLQSNETFEAINITSCYLKLQNNYSKNLTIRLVITNINDGEVISHETKDIMLSANYEVEISYPINNITQSHLSFKIESDQELHDKIDIKYFYINEVLPV